MRVLRQGWVVAVACLWAAGLAAQQGPMGGQNGMTHMGPMGMSYDDAGQMQGMNSMMGLGPVWMLDLSDEQRREVNRIRDELRRQNWATQGKVMDLRAEMRDLYLSDRPDPEKIGEVYGRIAELRREMIERNVTAHNEIRALLTAEQREQLKDLRRSMWMPEHRMRIRPRDGQQSQ